MKRVLSLILVLVLALGSVPFAFAEEAASMTAGETLQGYGLAKGVDAEGNLNEEGMLSRAEMMVMISRLLGVEEEAMNYAIPSTSKDVEGHWGAKYIAYAEQVAKWTNGVGDNRFAPEGQVTNQMVAKFMMTALGYEANWDTAVADATALGLMAGVEGEDTAFITRGDVFKASLNTVNTPKKDSEVTLGVALGVVTEVEVPVAALEGAVIDAATATGNAEIMIEFDEAVDMEAAAAATYVVTMKNDASKTIEVNVVNVESNLIVVLETAAMVKGTAYKVSVADTSAFFTGIEKDTDAPKVSSVKGSDTDRIEVKFDMNMDRATAEDISNYSINTIGTVTAAKVSDDRTLVELTVEGFEKVSSHKLTIENVMSVDGKVMSKVTRTFYPSFDKTPVSIDSIEKVTRSNNVAIYVYFKDTHGVDVASAEDISNYSIDGLEILSAEADEYKWVSNAEVDSDFFNRVELTTSTQKANTKYTLKINNIVDGSTAMNVITKELSDTFYGASEDKGDPSMLSAVKRLSSTLIRLTFKDDNKLDPTTVLDLSNYSIDDDELSILDVQFKDEDEDEVETIYVDVTVSEMDETETYKIRVNNISDEFGNSMDKEKTASFKGYEVNQATLISSVKVTNENTVVVTFSSEVTEATAEEFTNYSLDGDIGSPTDASLDAGETEVTLTFPDLTRNKTYEITINGVENYSGYATDNATKSFVATATTLDTEQPTVENVSFENKGLLAIEFSEEMVIGNTAAIVTFEIDGVTVSAATAMSLTGDNDQIIVFDATDIDANKDVDIIGFGIGITDVAGKVVEYNPEDESFATDDAFVAKDDSVEIVGWSQETVKEIRVYFDEAVKVVAPTTKLTLNQVEFEFDIDEDDDTVVIATVTGDDYLADGQEIYMNVSTKITDLAGRNTRFYNDKDGNEISDVTYEMYMDDDSDPQIIEVIATDINTVEVIYDEDLSSKGSYAIDDKTISATNTSLDKNVVTLTVGYDLSSEEYYVLEQKTLAKDLSKNTAYNETSDFEFVGTDVLVEINTIAGVAVINATTVRISDTDDFVNGTYNLLLTTSVSGESLTTVVDEVKVVGGKVTTGSPDNTIGVATDEITFTLGGSSKFMLETVYTIELTDTTYDTTSIDFNGIVEE